MIQPTDKQLRAISHMSMDEDFKDFVELLNASISKLNLEIPFISNSVNLGWMQGRLQELLDMRNVIDNASETVRAISHATGKKAPNI